MNDIRQCKYCNKLYNYIGNKLCPDCVKLMDEAQIKVRDYLYEHPGADVKTISEGAELDERTVLFLLKEGILNVNHGSGIDSGLRCSVCGKPISAGKMCEGCRTSLGRSLNSVLPESERLKYDPSYRREMEKKKKGMHLDFR